MCWDDEWNTHTHTHIIINSTTRVEKKKNVYFTSLDVFLSVCQPERWRRLKWKKSVFRIITPCYTSTSNSTSSSCIVFSPVLNSPSGSIHIRFTQFRIQTGTCVYLLFLSLPPPLLVAFSSLLYKVSITSAPQLGEWLLFRKWHLYC